MKKILFYYSKFNIGGAERSLSRMMNALVKDNNDVVLLTKYGNGTCESMLDKRINHIYLMANNNFISSKTMSSLFIKFIRYIEFFINFIFLYIKHDNYDLCVLGSQGISPDLPLKLFKINIIIRCIRNDLTKCNGHDKSVEAIKKYINKIDYYLCVSRTAKDSLISCVPEIQDKAIVYYNFLDKNEMGKKIESSTNPFNNDGLFHIVTVCRIADKAKGIFRMLRVCKRLIQDRYKLTWHIVGDGEDFERLKSEIKKLKLEDTIILPGMQENPFGYYKNADLVAVLSYYEGLCGVVNEAKISGAAVIATEFSGIHEQLTHGVNGWIVKNDENSIYEGIKYLMDNKNCLLNLKNNIYPEYIIDDRAKLQQLYNLLNWEFI